MENFNTFLKSATQKEDLFILLYLNQSCYRFGCVFVCPWANFRNFQCLFFLISKVEIITPSSLEGFPGGSEVKASACSVGDLDSIPGSGRSPGEGNGNPLQNSCLENPMDGGAWWATVHGWQRVGHD